VRKSGKQRKTAVFYGQRALSPGKSSAAQSGEFLVVLPNRSINSLVLVSLVQYTDRETFKIQIPSTMELSSLNVDVLLHLIGFVKPVDRFNLALSGVLKGFENVNTGKDLDKRYSEHFTFVIGGNRSVICPESNIVKLSWGYVVMARANLKSGESSNINR
jgi:hypothetical protein